MKSSRRRMFQAVAAIGTLSGLGGAAQAQLLLYDPFDYTAGQNLGGTDPDGAGPNRGHSDRADQHLHRRRNVVRARHHQQLPVAPATRSSPREASRTPGWRRASATP